MPSMIDATTRQQIRRMQADPIVRVQPRNGRVQVQPGLFFNRVSAPGERVHAVAEPSFCVIAQGSKDILLGPHRFRYDPAHYLITTMALPMMAEVVESSSEKPYLGSDWCWIRPSSPR